MRLRLGSRPLVLAFALASGAAAAPHVAPDAPSAMDVQTAEVLRLLRDGDLRRAAPLARALHARFPDYALGRLLHAELEGIAALDGAALVERGSWSRELIDLLAEARARLHLADTPTPPIEAAAEPGPPALRAPLVPRALVALGDDVDHVVLVDQSRSELLLYARGAAGRPELLERHYAAGGSGGAGKRVEGDLKTPLGVYRITGHRPDKDLPPLYGSGALTLDYPNRLDRELGRTGRGIWLHGVPRKGGSRAPRSSEGCVTMSNAHLDALVERLDRRRSLVVLADGLEWMTEEKRLGLRAERLAAAGRPGSQRPTLVDVPDVRGAPAWLAVSTPSAVTDAARPPGPKLDFVALPGSAHGDRERAMESLHAAPTHASGGAIVAEP